MTWGMNSTEEDPASTTGILGGQADHAEPRIRFLAGFHVVRTGDHRRSSWLSVIGRVFQGNDGHHGQRNHDARQSVVAPS